MTKRVSATPKKKKKKKEEASIPEDKQVVIINNIQPPAHPEAELRTINLYGDISEQKGADVVAALLYLENTSHAVGNKNPQDPESEQVIVARSISMMVSTHGGTASDMFSILDVMDMVKERTCDIETFGIGKVMSAGVLLLAAGTKGQRKIGKHCRVMMHSVRGGHVGTIHSLENEMEETRWIQKQHIQAMVEETNLTERQ